MMGFNIIPSTSSALLIVFVSNHFLLLRVHASSNSSDHNGNTGVSRQTNQSYSDSVQRDKRYTNQLDGKNKEAGLPAASASKGSRGLRLYVSHSHEDDRAESKEPEDTAENSDSASNESEGAESKEIYHSGSKRKPKGKPRKSHHVGSKDHKSKKYRQKLKAMQKTMNSLVRKGLRTGEEKKIIKKIAPALEARFHRQKHLQDLRDSKRTSKPKDSKQHLDDIYKMLRGMDDSASEESNPSKLAGKYMPKSSQLYQGRKQVANPMKGLKSLDESQEHQMKPQLYSGQLLLADETSRAKAAAGKPSRQMKGRRVNPVGTQADDGYNKSKSSTGSLQTARGGKSSMKGRRVNPIAAQTDDKDGKSSGKTTEEGRSSRLMKGGRKVTTVTTTTDDSKEKMVADKPSKTHKSKKIIVIEPGESVEVIRKSDGYKYPFEYVDMSYEDEEDCEDDNKKTGKQAGTSKGNTAVQNNKVK